MKKPRSNKKKLEPVFPAEPNPSDDFHFEIAKIAISQICQSAGFKSTHLSSLQALSRAATIYIKSVAETAASYSNRSNRTESNLFDLVNALHDLSSPQGFAGASTLHSNCSLDSKIMKDLSAFVQIKDEIPFAKPIPRPDPVSIPALIPPPQLPVVKSVVPKWLPVFPDECTYRKLEKTTRNWEIWENSEMVRSCREIIEKGKKNRENENSWDLNRKKERISFKLINGRNNAL